MASTTLSYFLFQLSKLCRCLDKIWAKEGCGEVILFRWIQFLLDETLTSLSIESPFPLQYKRACGSNIKRRKHDERAFQDVASYMKLVGAVVEYEQQEKIRVFSSSYFTCNVCFGEKPGSSCIEFHDCGHVFCTDCMGGYFKVQIEDGAVESLSCPTEQCESQALPSQVKQLVSPELFAKYDQFLLQHSLDGMSDIAYCPRPSCRSAVMLEKESSMGVCPSCSFAFCSFCKHSYHGVSPCQIRSLKKLHEEYNLASSDERELLEKRFGKRQIQNLVDEMISEEWLNSNVKYCPSCKSGIQKMDGCNKMTCTRCHAYFCWLCMATLSRSNPYQHFNGPESKCFNRLFEGVDPGEEGDDDDDEWWI